MKALIPAVFAFVVCAPFSFPQTPQLRQEAVQLLERANQVSMAPRLPNLERTVTFRVLDATTGPQEGSFTRVVVQGTGRRDEFSFGSFHLINVWARGRLATVRTAELLPAPVLDMLWLTPIRLLRFDHEDVIDAIRPGEANGRPARCIEFDTVAGDKTDHNELCMDAQNGALVTEKTGEDYIENSGFFSFAGALIPGEIRYSRAGIPKLEISQTMTVLENPTPNVLAAPPDAQIRRFCTTYRRAFGTFMPQPKPGSAVGQADVVVRGIIGKDGRVHGALIQSSERADLNAQALKLIQQWTFTPALCNGNPNDTPASFTLHFR
jgi:TonB family protein